QLHGGPGDPGATSTWGSFGDHGRFVPLHNRHEGHAETTIAPRRASADSAGTTLTPGTLGRPPIRLRSHPDGVVTKPGRKVTIVLVNEESNLTVTAGPVPWVSIQLSYSTADIQNTVFFGATHQASPGQALSGV